jgi:acyl carrier protein
MADQAVVELVIRLTLQRRNIAADKIMPNARLMEELGLDSLDITELVADLEKDLGRQLNFTSIEDLATAASIAEAIERMPDQR